MTIEQTLNEREKRYGNFSVQSETCQSLKCAMKLSANWIKLSSSQREALENISVKISRILSGNPNYKDSWHDIAGYAELIAKELD